MKKTIRKLTFLGLLTLIPISAFAEEITVTVKGMVCSFCAQGIKKTFGKIDNVKSVNVDLDKKVVKLDVKDGSATNDKEIEKTINDAGYDVVKIERTKNA